MMRYETSALPVAVPSNQTKRRRPRSFVQVAPSVDSISAVHDSGMVSSMRAKAPGSSPDTVTVTSATSGPWATTSRRAVVGAVAGVKCAASRAGARAASMRVPSMSSEAVGARRAERKEGAAVTRKPTRTTVLGGSDSQTYRRVEPERMSFPPAAMGSTRVRLVGKVTSNRAASGGAEHWTVQWISADAPGVISAGTRHSDTTCGEVTARAHKLVRNRCSMRSQATRAGALRCASGR